MLGGDPIAGSLGGDAASDAFVPATYGTAQVGQDWFVGIGVTSPWGLVTKYGTDFIGRYHALTSELLTMNVAPTVAWRVAPTLSLGAALQVQYAAARLSNAVDFGSAGAISGLGAMGLRPGGADGRATADGTDVALGYQLGLLWEPAAGTRLGLSFRSAVFHELSGDTTFEGVPAPLARAFRSGAARANFATPEVASVGLSQAIGPRWTVLADVSWTNWSRFGELRVQTEGRPDTVTEHSWRDSWFFALGAEYRATEALTLRGGVAYDQTPVPDATRTPRIPDSDRYWLSIGASYRIAPRAELSLAYIHVFGTAGAVRLRDRGPGTPGFLRGDHDLEYSLHVDMLALQARIAF